MPEPNHQYLAELVVRSQHHDADAFTELYALTYNRVYNYARHYLRDDYLAQDALQEIYISAYRNMDKLNDPTLFIAWLNRISFHVCYDIQQKRSEHKDISDPELLELVQDEHPGTDPEALAMHTNEIQLLHQALNELPFHEREVLVLRYYNDMKLEEIAGAMELSRSTVKRYIASGKEHLAQKLGG